MDRARAEPEGRFHSLAHLIDVPALAAAYWRIRKDAAVGVDGVTKDQYGQDLERNLQDLYARLRSKRYRHQPIRRVHIPKDGGRTRPIGISALEDKMVQSAVRHVLEAIYEQDFLDCSFGFRAGRNAHAAIRALDKVVHRGEVNWILEADIVSFFDSLDRTKLKEMLQVRVTDGSLLRLIGKLLRVGVLDGEAYTTPDRDTAQGSGLSPLLGNVYLHYALDVWFDQVVRPRLRGRATLVRYADDFVIGFERRDDAERVMDVLPKRLGTLRTHTACGQDPCAARLGDRLDGNRGAKVRPHSTSWGSRCIGDEPAAVAGACGVRHGPRVCSERLLSPPPGVVAIDTCRWPCNTPRSRDASRGTSITLA